MSAAPYVQYHGKNELVTSLFIIRMEIIFESFVPGLPCCSAAIKLVATIVWFVISVVLGLAANHDDIKLATHKNQTIINSHI